jgi:uncharacterized protein (TIGR03067 family)
MTLRSAWAVAIVSFLAASVLTSAQESSQDHKAMQGKWRVVEYDQDGKQLSPELLKKMRVVIQGDRITIVPRVVAEVIPFTRDKVKFSLDEGKSDESQFKLDPSKKTKVLDLISTGEPKTTKGTYLLDENTLRICFALRNQTRPKQFPDEPKSGLVRFVLKREAAEEAREEAADKKADPEKLKLWNGKAPIGDGKFEDGDAQITVHKAEKPNGAAIVICPGGGYGGLVVGPEGHGIAAWLNRHGITGVVLEYRLPKGRSHVPLLDAQRAIRTVRARAKDWGVDPAKVGIMGFSAGGHLASTAGTHFDDGNPKADDAVERQSCRPDFMVLVYPVITMGEKTHGGSKNNLLGKNPDEKLVDLFSNEKQVTAKTPPTFLAHAKDDKPVPPENSKAFYDALQMHKVPSKYLELPSGGHGLNGYKGPMWDAWQEQSLAWLAEQKFIPPVAGKEK